MSSSTWTPGALSAEAKPLAGACWRVVEAQNRVSTLKLVDDLREQQLLENLIERAKPPQPPECRGLHYLLFTPFRYPTPPAGSRFRRGGMTEGVFYGSETCATAVAEIAFRRLLFFFESPETPWPSNAAEYTAFQAEFGTDRAVDLTEAPFDADRPQWTHCTDYTACQALAETARAVGIEIIRYESIRGPGKGINLALLSCRPFRRPEPTALQTWRIQLGPAGVAAICEFPKTRISFDRTAFAADDRIAAMRWDR